MAYYETKKMRSEKMDEKISIKSGGKGREKSAQEKKGDEREEWEEYEDYEKTQRRWRDHEQRGETEREFRQETL